MPHELCVCVCVCRCYDLSVSEHSCSRGMSTALLQSNICIDLFQHASVCSSVWVLLIPAQTQTLHTCMLIATCPLKPLYLSLLTFGQFPHS